MFGLNNESIQVLFLFLKFVLFLTAFFVLVVMLVRNCYRVANKRITNLLFMCFGSVARRRFPENIYIGLCSVIDRGVMDDIHLAIDKHNVSVDVNGKDACFWIDVLTVHYVPNTAGVFIDGLVDICDVYITRVNRFGVNFEENVKSRMLYAKVGRWSIWSGDRRILDVLVDLFERDHSGCLKSIKEVDLFSGRMLVRGGVVGTEDNVLGFIQAVRMLDYIITGNEM